jgi:ATP-dependent 26S proteasome regulatory subunit
MKKFTNVLKSVGLFVGGFIIGGMMFAGNTETEVVTKEVKVEDNSKIQSLEEEKKTLQAELKQTKDELEQTKGKLAEYETKEAEEQKKKEEEQKKAQQAPVVLGPGKHTVGEDIKPGKYIVSTQEPAGNFFVYGDFGFAEVNEILGTDKSFAVNDVSVELEEGQTIEISGLNKVTFKAK